MSFFRIKTVKQRQYLYKQTSVREGKKVRSVMEYIGALGGTYDAKGRSVPNRNADLKATTNPKRASADDEYMRHLFKTDREAFDRLHDRKATRGKEARGRKEAWLAKQQSPADKAARASDKQAAEAKFKDDMEVVREFAESVVPKM